MDEKKYRFITALITACTAAVLLAGILLNSLIIPVIAVATGMLTLVFFRKQFREITYEDERQRMISALSARTAMTIFCAVAAIADIAILITHRSGPAEIKAVGYTLCYSVCGLLIMDLAAYLIINKKQAG